MLAIIIGFPIAVVIAWVFELTPEGLKRTEAIPAGQPMSIARLKIDPVWDPIRNRPDFRQLLAGTEQIGPNK